MKKLGVMLYGRCSSELEDFVKANLESKAALDVRGVLDGLNDEQVTALAADVPATGVPEYLSNGSIVFVDHNEVADRAKMLSEQLKLEGIGRSVICCTAPWPSLETESAIIIPVKILEHVALSILPKGGTLAVIQPVEETKDEEIKHWQGLGVNIIRETVSPEVASDEELEVVAKSLLTQGADIIALDCLSFTRHHRDIVLKTIEKPTLLPMSLVGKVADEILGI